VLFRSKTIIKQEEQKSAEILNLINKKIENTIFQIKQSNADKDKTKELRKELDIFAQKEIEKRIEEDKKLNAKIEKIKNRKKKVKKEEKEHLPEKIEETLIEKGDFVKIKGQNTAGEILKINNKTASVAFGSVIMSIETEKLEKLNSQQLKSYKSHSKSGVTVIRNKDERTTNFINALDVRGKRANEALITVSDFIDNAVVSKVSYLRILHGTGNGILRDIIREFLRNHQFVKSFKDDRLELGGAGITVIDLEY